MVEIIKESLIEPYRKYVKIDKKDEKILQVLLENSRTPASTIGKKVRLSTVSITKRVEKLKEKGVIISYPLILDLFKLGYEMRMVMASVPLSVLRNMQIPQELEKYIFAILETYSKHNAIIIVLTKDIFEFNKVLHKLNQLLHIQNYTAMPIKYFDFQPYKLFEGEKYLKKFTIEQKKYSLQDIDIKIIREMRFNARIPILQLAKKLSVSKEKIITSVNRLKKEKVIQHFFTNANMFLLGYQAFGILFKLKNTTKLQTILNKALNHALNTGVYLLDGEFQIFTIFVVQKPIEISDIFKELIPNEEVEYELFPILKQHMHNPVPKTIFENMWKIAKS